MLYSQLYRSILLACRELSRRPYYTNRTNSLIISLPLLISVPSAYGAIVSPQVETTASVKSTDSIVAAQAKDSKTSRSSVAQTNKVATLQDSSSITYRTIATDSELQLKQSKAVALGQTDTNPLNTNQSLSKNNGLSNNDTLNRNKAEAEALQAVGFEQNSVDSKERSANSFTANNPIATNIPTYPEDEYINVESANHSTSKQSNQANKVTRPKNNSKDNEYKELKAPTRNNRTSVFTTETGHTDPIQINKTNEKTNPSKLTKISENRTNNQQLAKSFKQDSVQKSLERLSQYYQQQANELRERLNINNDNVIEAQAFAPAVSPEILNLQYETTKAPRCEGVWVTPNTTGADANYQRAVQSAQQQDGLTTADGLPLYAVADYGYYDNESYVELSGNVEIMQNGKLVTANEIALDLNSGIAGAKGDVVLADSGKHNGSITANNQNTNNNLNTSNTLNTDSSYTNTSNNTNNDGMIAVAEELAYNTNDSRATAYDVAFASVPMQAHGYAQKLNKADDSHYELEKVMFSTCPPMDRKWHIEAQQIDIDTDSGRGEAYNATFRLGDVPVLYLPYFNFPVDDRRSSGLLTPSARIDSDSGLKLSVPYYLNLAPDYDATITTDVYSNRNPMITGEFRYLTEDYGQGSLTTAYMPKDQKFNDEDRTGVFYRHQWASKKIPRLTADAVYSYVSDPDYLNDFDDYGLVDNKLNLPRRARVNYYDDFINAQFKVETFQSLEGTDSQGNRIPDKDKPYSRLPQLTIDYRLPEFNNILDHFVITGTHDSAYFKKSIDDGSENEKSGVRLYNEINASYPMEKSWGYIKPKVSLQHLYTAYDEESRLDNNVAKEDNDQSALVPSFSVDSGLNFYNVGSPFGWFDDSMGGYQLLSPRLKYSYSPYKDQSAIPNFDTRIASIDYDQLFADSWFLGHDRIADKNSLALGINYRYIDAIGITRFDGGIGDQYFLSKPKVGLEADEGTLDINSTGVAWRSSIQPYRNLWFDVNGTLDSDYKLNYVTSQIRYNPTPNSLFNFGVIERKKDTITNQSALSALTASTIIPINDNWRLLGQGQYDTDEDKFIDATVGIDYEDCCYGFSIYGRSYYNDLKLDDKPTRAIMAEFRINGFGNSKGRLSKHLDQKILGFEPVDELWKR